MINKNIRSYNYGKYKYGKKQLDNCSAGQYNVTVRKKMRLFWCAQFSGNHDGMQFSHAESYAPREYASVLADPEPADGS